MHDYPIEISPFARATDDDPTLTERFEFFIGGMELGNAFSEINDAATQQARFEQQARQLEGEPGDPDYVEALSYGMPPTGGLGLGIDRLVMLLTGRETIRDVVLFPGAALDVVEAGGRRYDAARRSLERDHVGQDLVERPLGLPADRRTDLLRRRDPVEHVLDPVLVDLVVGDVRERRGRVGQLDHPLGERRDRDAVRGADVVDLAGHGVVHQAAKRADRVLHVAEAARLVAVAVDLERLAGERPLDEASGSPCRTGRSGAGRRC